MASTSPRRRFRLVPLAPQEAQHGEQSEDRGSDEREQGQVIHERLLVACSHAPARLATWSASVRLAEMARKPRFDVAAASKTAPASTTTCAATMPRGDCPPPGPGSAYRLTDEQSMLRDAVRVLADEQIAPRAAEIDRTAEFPQDVRALLAAHDILALPFAERFGGLGGELLTLCVAIEQISRACATSGLILAVQELGALPIILAGSEEQQERWLPGLASGQQLIAFALTEAEAGSDVAATRTRAARDGDAYVIDGSKRFISHGSVADLITVFALTDPDAPRHRRLSCFVVEVPTEGFSVPRIEHKMGIGAAHGRAGLHRRPGPGREPHRRGG